MTIKQKQCLLAYLGYYVGDIDGKWGPLSKVATTAFQKDFGGIAVDGSAGPETQKALLHAVAYGMPVKEPVAEPEGSSWWNTIRHFTRDEFKCKCGGKYCDGYPVEPVRQLVELADDVREHFGAPANISSGLRCVQHNAHVGGVTNSRHLIGKAVDFHVKGRTAIDVLAYVKTRSCVRYAYAIDENYVHMDVN